MAFLPFLHFFSFTICLTMAVVTVVSNPRARTNHLFAVFLGAMTVWSFGKIFVHNPYATQAGAMFFENISALGWTSFCVLFLMFAAYFTEEAGCKRIYRLFVDIYRLFVI